MSQRLTRVEGFVTFSGLNFSIYPDRTRSFDPATDEVNWELGVPHEDDRVVDLKCVPFPKLMIARKEEGVRHLSFGDLLDATAKEWPDHIRLDATILSCLLSTGSRDRELLRCAMDEKRLSRVLVSTIILHPEKPEEEFVLGARLRIARDQLGRAQVSTRAPTTFHEGVLLLAP